MQSDITTNPHLEAVCRFADALRLAETLAPWLPSHSPAKVAKVEQELVNTGWLGMFGCVREDPLPEIEAPIIFRPGDSIPWPAIHRLTRQRWPRTNALLLTTVFSPRRRTRRSFGLPAAPDVDAGENVSHELLAVKAYEYVRREYPHLLWVGEDVFRPHLTRGRSKKKPTPDAVLVNEDREQFWVEVLGQYNNETVARKLAWFQGKGVTTWLF